MDKNHTAALAMLDAIDRTRSGSCTLEELEQNLWRLLEVTDVGFPATLVGRLENLVLELKQRKSENLRFGKETDVHEDLGVDEIYNEATGALGRFLG